MTIQTPEYDRASRRGGKSAKKRQKICHPPTNAIDSVKTLQAELDEGIEFLRPHYPEATDMELRARAESLRPRRYAGGRWPDFTVARDEAAIAQEEAGTTEDPLLPDAPAADAPAAHT